MPFRGKPSLGCENCRQRKIRCDSLRPSCSQCIKARKSNCSYRDISRLMILDETTSVERKAQKSTSRYVSKAKHNESSQENAPWASEAIRTPGKGSLDSNNKTAKKLTDTKARNMNALHAEDDQSERMRKYFEQTLAQHWCILPTVKQLALGVFRVHFIDRHSHFSYLPSIPNPGQVDTPLTASVEALGMAFLSRSGLNVPNVRERARAAYGYSLRLLNRALQDPMEARKDGTLLATLIVSKFETAYSPNRLTLDTWAKHIDGASQLARFRGREQFQHLFGFRMFTQTYSNLLISCSYRNVELPAEIIKLRGYSDGLWPSAHHVWRYIDALTDFFNFRAQYRRGLYKDPEAIITTLQNLIQRFDDASSRFERPRVVKVHLDSELLYAPYVHIFHELSVMMIWNALRLCRILLRSLIRSQIRQLSDTLESSPSFSKYINLYKSCGNEACADMIEICAIVPQISGYLAFIRPIDPSETLPIERLRMERTLAVWKGGPTGGPILTVFSHFADLNAKDCELLSKSIYNRPKSTRGLFYPKQSQQPPVDNSTPKSKSSPETIVWFGPAALPWFLFIMSTQECAPQEMRDWSAKRLNHFAQEFENPYAEVLAAKIERGERSEYWQDPWHRCANRWCFSCNPALNTGFATSNSISDTCGDLTGDGDMGSSANFSVVDYLEREKDFVEIGAKDPYTQNESSIFMDVQSNGLWSLLPSSHVPINQSINQQINYRGVSKSVRTANVGEWARLSSIDPFNELSSSASSSAPDEYDGMDSVASVSTSASEPVAITNISEVTGFGFGIDSDIVDPLDCFNAGFVTPAAALQDVGMSDDMQPVDDFELKSFNFFLDGKD